MFKITDDIEIEMSKLYPDIDVKLFIHQLFTKMVDKTLESGGCTIRDLGKYIAYSTFSTKLNRQLIRIKFVFSQALIKKIRFDDILLENLPVKNTVVFDETNEAKCKNKKHLRINPSKLRQDVTKHEEEHTNNNLGKLEIMKILEG